MRFSTVSVDVDIDDVLQEIGWDDVREYFKDEIEEELNELREENESDMADIQERLDEVEAELFALKEAQNGTSSSVNEGSVNDA